MTKMPFLPSDGPICGLAVLLACLQQFGCALPTPHENFKRNLQTAVGSQANRSNIFMDQSKLLSEVRLPNGDIEYSYLYANDCVIKFVVDQVTQRIVRATFEGSEKSCQWVP